MSICIKSINKPAVIIGILMSVWFIGYFFFMITITKHKPLYENKKTDAIIVVTGGSGRINEGLDLLAKGNAHHLFISGVGKNVQVKELYKLWKGEESDINCCVTLDHVARNTRGNAQETKKWMVSKGYRSLRLVTSSYHMPRAWLEFHHEMPSATIILHPAKDSFKDYGDKFFLLVWQEYNKSLLTYFRNMLGGRD